MKRENRGFTLIEVLVVLAIIGVLFTLIMPAVSSARARSHTASCMNNMKQLALAAFMYADDNDEQIPAVSDTTDYIDNEDVYACPRDTNGEPSYTAHALTPPSLRPSDIEGIQAERILYVESDTAVTKQEGMGFVGGGDIAYRHSNRTVIVFADGHSFAWNDDQVAQLISSFDHEEPIE